MTQLINSILHPFKSIKKYNYKKEEALGFSWAATQLLYGTPLDKFHSYIDVAKTFRSWNSFDYGVLSAVRAWERNICKQEKEALAAATVNS